MPYLIAVQFTVFGRMGGSPSIFQRANTDARISERKIPE
jgi:hypothetical protein